jgi:hypothetical protein
VGRYVVSYQVLGRKIGDEWGGRRCDVPVSGNVALDGGVSGVVGELHAQSAGLTGVDFGGCGEGKGGEERSEEECELHFD